MPFRWKHALKTFKFELDPIAALPVATVESIGQGRWIMACPLCGCGHDVTTHKSPLYEPYCLANVFAGQPGAASNPYRTMRDEWRRKYPDAAAFKTVILKSIAAVDSGDSDQDTTNGSPEGATEAEFSAERAA